MFHNTFATTSSSYALIYMPHYSQFHYLCGGKTTSAATATSHNVAICISKHALVLNGFSVARRPITRFVVTALSWLAYGKVVKLTVPQLVGIIWQV